MNKTSGGSQGLFKHTFAPKVFLLPFIILLVFCILPSCQAIEFDVAQVTGKWTGYVFKDVQYCNSYPDRCRVYGLNTPELRWNYHADPQSSGLKFDGSDSRTIRSGDEFVIGKMTHMNYPVRSSVEKATLRVTLILNSPLLKEDPEFTFNFSINETVNDILPNCPGWQLSSVGCDDKITFPNSFGSESYTFGDQIYTLRIIGFKDSHPQGSSLSAFVTQEDMNSTAYLIASLSTVIVEKPQLTLVKKLLNGVDTSSAPGPTYTVGDQLVWTYVVQNTGNVKLNQLQILDDEETVVCPTFTLAAGESVTCTAKSTAIEGTYESSAVAQSQYQDILTSNKKIGHYIGVKAIVTPGVPCMKTNSCGATAYGVVSDGDCNAILPPLPEYFGTFCKGSTNICGITAYGVLDCNNVCNAGTSPLPIGYGRVCETVPNACRVTGTGTVNCLGKCSAQIPSLPAGYGNSCKSPLNACGAFNTGIIGCNGKCSAITPALVANYSKNCTSPPNACHVTAYGVVGCDGKCSAVTPPVPSRLGAVCESAPNSCGQRNIGKIDCTGDCSAKKPSDTNCGCTGNTTVNCTASNTCSGLQTRQCVNGTWTNYSTCKTAYNLCNDQCVIGNCTFCGDKIIQKPNSFGQFEICDGNNITCAISGYYGVRWCNSTCDGWTECKPFNKTVCGNGIVEAKEECDDGNKVNDDACTNKCTKPVYDNTFKACSGTGQLILYRGTDPFQNPNVSFVVKYDQLLIFVREDFFGDVFSEIHAKVNGVSTPLQLAHREDYPFGASVYMVSTKPGDLVSIGANGKWLARSIQGYISQNSSKPVYNVNSMDILHDAETTNKMNLKKGEYQYIFFDKYTINEHEGMIGDYRNLSVTITYPNGKNLNHKYTRPYPAGTQGVVTRMFNASMNGTYTMKLTTQDSVYWLPFKCD